MADEQRPDSLKDGIKEARFANYFNIGHNAFEVILEFGQFYEGNRRPILHTRVVTSPAYAKQLLQLLSNSLEEHERAFGIIPTDGRMEPFRTKREEG